MGISWVKPCWMLLYYYNCSPGSKLCIKIQQRWKLLQTRQNVHVLNRSQLLLTLNQLELNCKLSTQKHMGSNNLGNEVKIIPFLIIIQHETLTKLKARRAYHHTNARSKSKNLIYIPSYKTERKSAWFLVWIHDRLVLEYLRKDKPYSELTDTIELTQHGETFLDGDEYTVKKRNNLVSPTSCHLLLRNLCPCSVIRNRIFTYSVLPY